MKTETKFNICDIVFASKIVHDAIIVETLRIIAISNINPIKYFCTTVPGSASMSREFNEEDLYKDTNKDFIVDLNIKIKTFIKKLKKQLDITEKT